MRKPAALTIVLAMIVAACGNGGDEDALGMGDRGLDRCSLITVDEAGQWLGSPVFAAPSEGFDGLLVEQNRCFIGRKFGRKISSIENFYPERFDKVLIHPSVVQLAVHIGG